MMRDVLGTIDYWNKWIDFVERRELEMLEISKSPQGNPSYRAQYIYEISGHCYEQIFRRYSCGDPISELTQYFPKIIKYWEEAENLGRDVWSDSIQYTRHAWKVNLDHYMICFWLVGLALALNIPEDQWKRLLVLIGNEGEDELLDKVIATRQVGRKIGSKLCHPKPYRRLLNAINAPLDKQPVLLREFVDQWFVELGNPATPERATQAGQHEKPYWYFYLNYDFEGGAYFGQWCVEAVAAVKALGINDELCLGHRHYPGDLLRPTGPSTHSARSDNIEVLNRSAVVVRKGILTRMFGRRG